MSAACLSPRLRSPRFAGPAAIVLALAGLANAACQAQPPAASGPAPRAEPASSVPRAAEAPSPAPATGEASPAEAKVSTPSPRYEIQGHTLELEAKPGPCVLMHRATAASAPRAVELGLSGPCYIMPWAKPPPPRDPNGPSAALPLGTTGDARAYTYENGVTALLVIGNPVPPAQAERAEGYHCAGGSRGVLLQGGQVMPSKRIVEAGSRIHCVEWGGPDEKEYWLFAHD